VGGIGWGLQQMDGFHQAVEAIERKQHGIRRISTRNHDEILATDNIFDELLQVVVGIGEKDAWRTPRLPGNSASMMIEECPGIRRNGGMPPPPLL